jgi:hypothetical protein
MAKAIKKVITDVETAVTAERIEGLTEGRMVHYVTARGHHRPSVIVQVWDDVTGRCNLQVFMDGRNDGYSAEQGTDWLQDIEYSEEAQSGTWHFIERA